MSGYGAGVNNIDVGIGKLWIAYLGGLDDDIASPTTGTFYKHSLDVRLKNIDVFGIGKLMLVGIANYEKGSTFTVDFNGNKLANPLRTDDAYGLGGGASLKFDLSAIGPRRWSYVDNVRGYQSNTNPTVNPGTLSPTAFGRSGNMGVLTIAPTIKPKGGYFSRPELRVFATYALWSDGLKVATTPIQEGNNLGGFTPSPYANGHANQGWLFGIQVEWFF
jgi:maltoporin